MKKLRVLALCAFMLNTASAQTSVELKDLGAHVGDSVTVCGTIYSARFFSASKDSLTLLNMGAAYPNQLLTILIRPGLRGAFAKAPEEAFRNKMVCVSGKVILYHDKPEIILYQRAQISEIPAK